MTIIVIQFCVSLTTDMKIEKNLGYAAGNVETNAPASVEKISRDKYKTKITTMTHNYTDQKYVCAQDHTW